MGPLKGAAQPAIPLPWWPTKENRADFAFSCTSWFANKTLHPRRRRSWRCRTSADAAGASGRRNWELVWATHAQNLRDKAFHALSREEKVRLWAAALARLEAERLAALALECSGCELGTRGWG